MKEEVKGGLACRAGRTFGSWTRTSQGRRVVDAAGTQQTAGGAIRKALEL